MTWEKKQRTTLSLQAIEGACLPEEQTYQSQLRAAMSGAVSEADVGEVVKQIVDGAKKGDKNAQKMFFEYLVGVKNAPTKISVHNHFPDVESAARAEKAQRRNGSRLNLEHANGSDD